MVPSLGSAGVSQGSNYSNEPNEHARRRCLSSLQQSGRRLWTPKAPRAVRFLGSSSSGPAWTSPQLPRSIPSSFPFITSFPCLPPSEANPDRPVPSLPNSTRCPRSSHSSSQRAWKGCHPFTRCPSLILVPTASEALQNHRRQNAPSPAARCFLQVNEMSSNVEHTHVFSALDGQKSAPPSPVLPPHLPW